MPNHRKPDIAESYALLPSGEDDDDSPDNRSTEKLPSEGSSTLRNTSLNSFFVALLAFLFVFDIMTFIYAARILKSASVVEAMEDMEFKNPYYGLDALYATNTVKPSHYGKIINEPRTAAQISSVEPNKVFPIGAHNWLSDFGVLSPPDRRLQVSATVDTIMQFNVLDYRMEKCALAIRLPSRGASLPHPYTLPVEDSVLLDICELDVKRPIKQRNLSWMTRPRCSRSLGVIEARVGEEVELEPFHCKSGSYLGYQLSCSAQSASCNVDVWSNQNATWGFYINQYQT